MILRLHHAQITVPKEAEEQAREFYCGFLGLKEIEKPDAIKARGGLWLDLGGNQVHIGTEDGVDRAATKAHIAFEVSNLVEWTKKISAAKLKPLEGIPIPGYDRFEFRDPFGNRIEMLQRI